MDAQAFWSVIGAYNEQTAALQAGLLLFAVAAVIASYSCKVKWAAKFALGIIHLLIGVVFFAWYGTEPIQKYFALPLYLLCGTLFLYESWHNRDDSLAKPNGWQRLLLVLYLLYPLISFLLVFLERGASEIASAYSLNEYAADIITGIILFFILGSEFFINYRLIWRGHHKEVQGK